MDKINSKDDLSVVKGKSVGTTDVLNPRAKYKMVCFAPVESKRKLYVSLRNAIEETKLSMEEKYQKADSLSGTKLGTIFNFFLIRKLENSHKKLVASLENLYKEFNAIPTYVKFEKEFSNLLTTEGKNLILDEALAGSGYTASFSVGLIDNAGYTAVAIGDVMNSHAGWAESTAYSNATRIAAVWSAASAAAKALSSALVYNINVDSTTIVGAFISTSSTKGGTTGSLLSAGAFSGGTEAVDDGDTLSVSYSISFA